LAEQIAVLRVVVHPPVNAADPTFGSQIRQGIIYLLSIELTDKVIRGKRPTPTSTINSRKNFTISWLQNITPEFFLEKNTTFTRFFKVLFAVVSSNSTCDYLPLKFSQEGCRQNHRRHPQLSGRHHPLQRQSALEEKFS
jgi:hypothetical protein